MNYEEILSGLHKRVSVSESKIHGKGIIADNNILENTEIRITYQWDYINHSEEPNCELIGDSPEDRKLRTLREIKKGEELTFTYAENVNF